PLFLLWIYFTWLIVLFGLEVTSAMQWLTREHVERISQGRAEPVAFDPSDGVAILMRVGEAFRKGRAIPIEELAEGSALPASLLERCIAALVRKGYLHDVDDGNDAAAYCLARPPESISVREVLELGYGLRGEDEVSADVRIVREMVLSSAGERTIADLGQGDT
ncbi:MAG: Rrf2 family transcriptional regulator, partial [Phycisphaerales bacterium]|nr:Rrf2 family transcriptional regulator [Phycisphaerales bacterium]